MQSGAPRDVVCEFSAPDGARSLRSLLSEFLVKAQNRSGVPDTAVKGTERTTLQRHTMLVKPQTVAPPLASTELEKCHSDAFSNRCWASRATFKATGMFPHKKCEFARRIQNNQQGTHRFITDYHG